ncbi:hypothetical protein P7K49_008771 [Saguinus oedipus]|uniref:Uncharacterized protein n=1 Tax=Saguinus oedipus TaxID=9490 RepID=A0ABQ9VZ90_SAGOE|nr:hypothetical protein P7K49_008771 [Saguinus oedipus]
MGGPGGGTLSQLHRSEWDGDVSTLSRWQSPREHGSETLCSSPHQAPHFLDPPVLPGLPKAVPSGGCGPGGPGGFGRKRATRSRVCTRQDLDPELWRSGRPESSTQNSERRWRGGN